MSGVSRTVTFFFSGLVVFAFSSWAEGQKELSFEEWLGKSAQSTDNNKLGKESPPQKQKNVQTELPPAKKTSNPRPAIPAQKVKEVRPKAEPPKTVNPSPVTTPKLPVAPKEPVSPKGVLQPEAPKASKPPSEPPAPVPAPEEPKTPEVSAPVKKEKSEERKHELNNSGGEPAEPSSADEEAAPAESEAVSTPEEKTSEAHGANPAEGAASSQAKEPGGNEKEKVREVENLEAVGSAEKEARLHEHEEGLVSTYGITGKWFSLRETLESHGITVKGLYTGEVATNFSASVPQKTESIYHDNLDLTMSIDTEKAGLWKGGTFWVYGLRDHGNDPSAYMIGDLQTASNIGTTPDQFILYEAWFNQDFADGRFSALFGRHNLNSEFYVCTYCSTFINSSFGIGPEVSKNVPVSIFPKAGLGARLRVKPTEKSYVQAAAYDGDPSTGEVGGAEGILSVAEAGLVTDGSDYKIGYWNHSADKTYSGKSFSGDYGVYGIVDQQIVQFQNPEHSSINFFLQYGWVPNDRNLVTGYVGAGLHLHGLIPTRTVDDIGLAVASAQTHQDTETTYELVYRLVLAPWLAVRPSLQWIQNPGGNAALNTINIGLLRFEIQL